MRKPSIHKNRFRKKAPPIKAKRLMKPLIEKVVGWALEFVDDLKPETQQDVIDKVSDKLAGYVNSSETGLDNIAAQIFLAKLRWLIEETSEKILDPNDLENVLKAEPVTGNGARS